MIVGCYSMDLYCDDPRHQNTFRDGPDQFVGPTEGSCNHQARKAGWKLDLQNFKATCPACRKRKANE